MRDRRALGWAVAGALIQIWLLVGYFQVSATLVLLPSLFVAFPWVFWGAGWVRKHSLVGGLLLGVVLGVPVFMIGYVRYLARVLPTRMAAYDAALPIVLDADRLHCEHPPAGSAGLEPSCELQDYLPATVTGLGQVSVYHNNEGPTVNFRLLPGRDWVVMHDPGPPHEPPPWLCSLGNGWYTTICRVRRTQ